jgi:NAD(P)-dependent dehydrogenase (short-subunit alcohol dehydrogenase family)
MAVVLTTKCSSLPAEPRLGAAVTRLLVERGARGIVICGRNVKAGREQAETLSHGGCEVIFVEADISSPEACKKWWAPQNRRLARCMDW